LVLEGNRTVALLRLFGTVELLGSDGEAILSILAQPKRTALLVYLAVARPQGFHRRDKLLAVFWPELDSERARAALSSSLTFLRKSLGEDVILTRGNEEVGIDRTELWTDVGAFEEALGNRDPGSALEQYRGHLLEGFFLSGCPEFEYWLGEERERLRELASGAAWKLADRQIEAGELVGAERTAQKALRWMPTDESPVRGFIQALAAAGDRAAAVRFYEKFARVLQEELELEPSAETGAIAAEIRAGSMVEGIVEARRSEVVASGESGPGTRPEVVLGARPLPADHVAARVVPAGHPPAKGVPSTNLWRLRALGGAAGLGVVAVAALLLSFRPWGGGGRAEERIVVLPFENMTGESSLAIYGSWAAEYITSGLMEAGLTGVATLQDRALGIPNPTQTNEASRDLRQRWPAQTRATLAVRGAFYLCPPGDSIEFRLDVIDPDGTIRGVVPAVRGLREDPGEGLGKLQVQVVGAVAEIVAPGHPLALTAQGRSPPKLGAYKAMNEGWTIFASVGYEASIPIIKHALELDSLYFLPLILLKSAYNNLNRKAQVDSICAVMAKRIHLATPSERQAAEYHCRNLRTPNRTLVDITRDMAEWHPVNEYLFGGMLLGANRPGEAVEVLARYDTALGVVAREWEDTNAYYWAMGLHLIEEHSKELKLVRDVRKRFPENRPLIFQEIAALIALGRPGEGLRMIDDRLALWPAGRSPVTLFEEPGQEFDAHGYPEEARELWQKALDWLENRPAQEREDGDNRQARSRLLLYLDSLEVAEPLLVPLASETPGNITNQGLLGILRAKQGDRPEVERISEFLATLDPAASNGQNQVWQARIAAQLGEKEKAVELLEQAMEEEWWLGDNLHRDVFMKPLRGYPAFEEFLRPKG
jgi:DNA-binding SARP family transcriptional activator